MGTGTIMKMSSVKRIDTVGTEQQWLVGNS